MHCDEVEILDEDEFVPYLRPESEADSKRNYVMDTISTVKSGDKLTMLYVYPNPFMLNTTIAIQQNKPIKKRKMKLLIFNSKGNQLDVPYEMEQVSKQQLAFKLAKVNMTSGLYFYQILKGNNRMGSGKLMVQ